MKFMNKQVHNHALQYFTSSTVLILRINTYMYVANLMSKRERALVLRYGRTT